MPKELWINLPVKNLDRSKQFFTALGFSFHPRFDHSDEAAGLIIGDKEVMVMLFPESSFKNFTRHEVSDTKQATQVLLSIEVESRAAVDEIVRQAEEAGGKIYGEPSENQGWMYGAGFIDLDGHRWNVLYIDMSKAPQG